MKIVFDPAKDAANIRKHRGLSLSDAERANWDEAVVFPDNRFDYGEARLCALAPVGNRLCHITFVELEDDAIRTISVRYAERNEVADYVRNYR
jgi:uncharacterized DUF497 family protein